MTGHSIFAHSPEGFCLIIINPKNAIKSDDRQAYGHQNPAHAEFELCALSF